MCFISPLWRIVVTLADVRATRSEGRGHVTQALLLPPNLFYLLWLMWNCYYLEFGENQVQKPNSRETAHFSMFSLIPQYYNGPDHAWPCTSPPKQLWIFMKGQNPHRIPFWHLPPCTPIPKQFSNQKHLPQQSKCFHLASLPISKFLPGHKQMTMNRQQLSSN